MCNIVKKITPLSDNKINELKNLYTYSRERRKTIIHRADSVFDYTLFLGKGLIRSYYLSPEGKDITYFFFKENDFVCDFESFLLQKPGNYYFETLEECEFIKIGYKDVQKLYVYNDGFQKFSRIITENAYLRVEQRLRMFMTLDLEFKYKTLLQFEPELVQRVPQYYLASYLGVSAEALSRLRSRI